MGASVYVEVFYGIEVKASDLLEESVIQKRIDCHPEKNEDDDKFCSECGITLNVEEHSLTSPVTSFKEVPDWLQDETLNTVTGSHLNEWLQDCRGSKELDFTYTEGGRRQSDRMFLGKELLNVGDVMYGPTEAHVIGSNEAKFFEQVKNLLDANGFDGSGAQLYCIPRVLI